MQKRWFNPLLIVLVTVGFLSPIQFIQAQTFLIPLGSTWKYLDNGTDQGTAWRTTSFNDTSWASGPAQLGYGDGDEATVVSFGPNSGNKYITTYFRHSFQVDDPSAYVSVVGQITYDDGFVLYVNGTEVLRENMPEGTILFNTTAPGAADYTPLAFNFPANLLQAGNNVIAVEMHQAGTPGSISSSDLSLDLSLEGDVAPTVTLTSPANGQAFTAPASITVSANASDVGGTILGVDFYDGENRISQDTVAPYSIVWTNALDGPHVLTARATDNTGNTSTSSPINITVADPNPPSLVSASATTNQVTVIFSKRLSSATANNAGNYSISGGSGGVSVLNATLVGAGNQVTLNTGFMPTSETFTLTVNGVEDLDGQPIAPNSQIQFSVQSFTLADVGNPVIAGSLNTGPNGFIMTAGGTNIAGNLDQFSFSYVERLDDFDLGIRVNSLALSDSWAKAGLMARESTDAGSRYAGSLATPNVSGAFMQYRSALSGPTTIAGKFPTTYPNMWLRLRRSGDTFTAYAGVDGMNWQQLGSVQLPAAARPMLVGLALASGNGSASTTADFREFTELEGLQGSTVVLDREPLGPSTRRGPFAISEIMYNPRTVPTATNSSLEFIEIFNSQAWEEEIGGYRISGAVDYTFPAGTMMPAGGFLVIAREPSFVQSHYGLGGVLGPWEGGSTNGLPNDEGRIRLRGRASEIIQEVNYTDEAPWPLAGDNTGHSIVLARASLGEDDPKAWSHSYYVDGSPGQDDPYGFDPLDVVMINEFLAHTDDPQEDFIELYNHSNQPVNVSGAWLSDDPEEQKFQIPNGTTIPARGRVFFTQSTLGFALDSGGERIYLMNAAKTRVIDAVAFEGQANGISTGRYPDGGPSFSELTSLTPGNPNAPMLIRDIVINEFMYQPITGNDDDEYLELHNKGTSPIDVGGWRFTAGIRMTIPSNTVISAGGFLVVAQNSAHIIGKYPQLNGTNTVGNYDMNLANGGERIALSMPDEVLDFSTNEFNEVTIETNTIWIVVDEVTYSDGGRWGWWSDGGGSSLELKDPNTDNRQPANWADSDESQKAPWTTIEGSAGIGETLGTSNQRLMIYNPGGVGECLIDDVEVRNFGGANSITTNPGFESGATGWAFQGSHDHSRISTTESFSGSQSLHMRAASRGDNGPNRIYSPLLSPAAAGSASSPVTLRLRARWMRGWPEVLMLMQGDGIEVGGRLNLPSNLGSPGLPNSKAVANAGPAIWDVSHSPILPAAGVPVVVTARAIDPHGVSSMTLKYRIDSSGGGTINLPMVDTGLSGDAVAGDGLYSATLPAQPANAVIAFYLEARDGNGAINLFPQDVFPTPPDNRVFPTDAVSRELVIRWGEQVMPGSFGNYRIWLTSGNRNRWATRAPALNNAVLDGTFVYNNYRVIYNLKPQYAGSPWHRGQMSTGPDGTQRVDFDIEYPRDDRFLGVTDSVWNNPGNPGGANTSDRTAQSEQAVYYIFKGLNIHYNYRRYVHVFVNGSQRSTSGNISGNFIFEDSQQPNGEVIRMWNENEDVGDLYKIEDEFWFPDNGFDFSGNDDADLGRRNIPGTTDLQISAYRFAWRKRALDPGDSQLREGYASFRTLIDTVSPPGSVNTSPIPSLDAFDAIADIEQWMRIFATQHAVYNWDGYSFDRGKNAYMFVPDEGKSTQYTWDIDFSLGIDRGPDPNLFASNDPRIVQMWAVPAIRRAYLRAFQDLLDGPLRTEVLHPLLDKKDRALRENGVTIDAGQLQTIKNWIANIIPHIENNGTSFGEAPFDIAGPSSFSTDKNLLELSGTAPVKIRNILINGEVLNVVWLGNPSAATPTAWRAYVVADPGVNNYVLTAEDSQGNILPGFTVNLSVTYTGESPDPDGTIVFNEIMYNPTTTNAAYVEIHNRSGDASFDISEWEINGLAFEFPKGTILTNGEYIVVAKDLGAYTAAYGTPTGRLFAFDGNLDLDGETLTLIKPGEGSESDIEIDKVRYEPNAPWAAAANGGGRALQLTDAAQDNSRVSNWGDGSGWKRVTFTAPVGLLTSFTGTNLNFYLQQPGEVLIDDIEFVRGSTPGVGPNLLENPGFEDGVLTPWIASGSHANSFVTSEAARTGSHALNVVSTGSGTLNISVHQSLLQDNMNPSETCTLTFYYLPVEPGLMTFYLSLSSFRQTSIDISPVLSTPGLANSAAAPLPAYDPVWLNEVQPNNATGATDGFGERDPWIELYNRGTTTVSLDGYYLADNYEANLTQWAFPAGASIAPGEFKVVWMDGQTGQSSLGELHAGFTLNGSTGSVALVRQIASGPQITDYLNYSGLLADESYGDFPDGQPFHRFRFTTPTPGAVNIAKPAEVFINEWVAQNTAGLVDPADGNFEDWFELYNAGSEPVDLAGFYLTDDLGDDNKYLIPPGYVIPANGFLLVYADSDPDQNSTNSMDLHADFGLSLDGEAIGLFSPEGIEVDSVTFGLQTENFSQGRFPDGSANIIALAVTTPRASNINTGGNTAPVVAAIPDVTITLGQTLSFTAVASDAEAPPQILTYSLVGEAPAGASIHPATGAFTWTPVPIQAPSTSTITVRARDNGTPILTGDESFVVTVVRPPVVEITIAAGDVTLSFPTLPGKTYRVLYADALGDPWLALGSDQVATGNSLVIEDNTGGGQRYYQIMQVD